jgi:transcriptional activator of cad operon
VISIHNDGQHYIEMLKPDGRILSSHQIERPARNTKIPLYLSKL